jgi:hypothetical protein
MQTINLAEQLAHLNRQALPLRPDTDDARLLVGFGFVYRQLLREQKEITFN